MHFDSKYPHMICCTRLEGAANLKEKTLFDIKFYPWIVDSQEQYFAIAGTGQLIICQTQYSRDPPFSILRWINAEHEGANLNSVAWTKNNSGKPLLCTAGAHPRYISIVDVESGVTTRRLAGHGRSINDLAVSPKNTNLLASASEDFTIRLWNLHDSYKLQPCIAVLAGDGHRQPVLACSFHQSGHWLLSGGMDNAVALWAVPEAKDGPTEKAEEPEIIFYPHFYSAEVHDNLVDCIQFYDNLIISRCSKTQQGSDQNEILIWSIDGFDGSTAAALPAPISSPDRYTRSAFNDDPLSLGFKRLATLDMPDTDRFYLRFGIYHVPSHRPMLAMGNQSSRICFWDLQRLEEELYRGAMELDQFPHVLHNAMQEVVTNGHNTYSTVVRSVESVTDQKVNDHQSSSKRVHHDPFKPVKAHHSLLVNAEIVEDKHFTSRSTTWSPNGQWLISVGDAGVMVIMHRGEEQGAFQLLETPELP